jgi:hypothetical protein
MTLPEATKPTGSDGDGDGDGVKVDNPAKGLAGMDHRFLEHKKR